MSATIRVLPLDQPWATLGSGRFRGIVAEGIEATANPWGPDQLSFQIKVVDPQALRPELLPYTPLELEIDGMLVWAGRIRERPSDERAHTVQAEGWQYHADDDVLARPYVHTRLSDYRDQRSFLGADLTKFRVPGEVENDKGAITIGWRAGTNLVNGDVVGVTLDLGEAASWLRAVMVWESSNNDGNATLICRTTSGENPLTGSTDNFFTFLNNAGASGTNSGTAANARRYVSAYLSYSTIPPVTLANDVWIRIKALRLFKKTAYESFNLSQLKAHDVIKDALPDTAPLLNQSTELILSGSFSIPEYVADYRTLREIAEGINAYENYELRIAGGDLRTLLFRPRPSAPLFTIGEWSGSEFSDATVKGEEIYDKVVVTGTGPDAAPLVSTRTQVGTLVDRRGFHRARTLPISSAMTQAVADRFGDLWLLEHKTAPFSGRLVVVVGGVRRMLGHADVPPHELLLHANELIHFAHRVDPDTGAWGRDGRIASISYSHDRRQADLQIDDRRDHFETILARYGLLVG